MRLFRRILVPYDFSAPADTALAVAATLAREHRGRLVVLHVVTPFHPMTGSAEERIAFVPEVDVLASERRRLAALVTRALGRKAPPAAFKVTLGDPFHRIVDAARSVDLIVMATAGRTGLGHLLIGSVAEKVVRHAPVPVLTVRPTRTGRRAAR